MGLFLFHFFTVLISATVVVYQVTSDFDLCRNLLILSASLTYDSLIRMQLDNPIDVFFARIGTILYATTSFFSLLVIAGIVTIDFAGDWCLKSSDLLLIHFEFRLLLFPWVIVAFPVSLTLTELLSRKWYK